MSTKFAKERELILEAAKQGIRSNLKLSCRQKKYLKNLLLFALMNASDNKTVTKRNFMGLVNKLFKGFLLKIIKECLADDDDDTDFDESLEVELNNIIAKQEIKGLEEFLTPENIAGFLKSNTKGLSQRQILDRLLALREVKSNYRETPQEQRKREQRQRDYELQRVREHMMEGRILTRGPRGR